MRNIEDIFSRFRLSVQYLIDESCIKSQRELGKELGLKDSSISGIMKGRSNPTLEQVAYLVEKYNINIRYLFHGEEPIQFSKDEIDPRSFVSEVKKDLQKIFEKYEMKGF